MVSSPSFVREPEGNGCAERFIRTLKEQLLWVRTFATVAELVEALREFKRTYNERWLIGRHGHRTPSQVRRDLVGGESSGGVSTIKSPSREPKGDTILRRIVPYHLGAVPAHCLALYERMASEGPAGSRYWACMALLLCRPEADDAASIAIELIGEPGEATGSWGPIELLKQRFAENFFWDTAAWKQWWTEYGSGP